jgi:hypothetical protein
VKIAVHQWRSKQNLSAPDKIFIPIFVAFECVICVFLCSFWRKTSKKAGKLRDRGLTPTRKAFQSLAFGSFMETESTQEVYHEQERIRCSRCREG